jgi:O-antigen/teichoic acid export membrane protein
MIALFLVFQRTVFSVFFGPEYSADVGLFVILSVGWVVRAAAGAFGQVMIMYGQGMVMMRFAFWWSVISIPLEYGLWRIAGAQGIAIGAAVLLGIYCIMASRMTRRKLNINVNIFMTQSY